MELEQYLELSSLSKIEIHKDASHYWLTLLVPSRLVKDSSYSEIARTASASVALYDKK